ncbi:MAG: hypothetical protein ACT4QD_02545 [Acidobacteriota bacterium]
MSVLTLPLVLTVLVHGLWATTAAAQSSTFEARSDVEAIATVSVRCEQCAWDVVGREAVMLRVLLDERYVQHLPVVRSGVADYQLMLGAVLAGSHTLRLEEDPELTAAGLRGGGHARVERVAVEQVASASPAFLALSLAPFVYARPDTVGHFTDVPVFMWVESEPTPRGTRLRYSVIFTNEDGGTPADRLMATWGRTTDIEYLYSAEVDARGVILADDIQGPEHEILPFVGRRERRHPLLWVVTDNNMVLDNGTTTVRYAPAPVPFPLRGVSREAVMDAHPWLYETMALELRREGKIAEEAGPGTGVIPDPRRFVVLEACGELNGAALAFAVGLDQATGGGSGGRTATAGGRRWIESDRHVREYRVARDGCFRVAIPLPAAVALRDLRALRAQAYARGAPGSSRGTVPANAKAARLTSINAVFMLDEQFRPGPSAFRWRGARSLVREGAAAEWVLP